MGDSHLAVTPAVRLQDLATNPNALASHYTRFRVAERLLLTGHSHQAWPDCGFAAQQQAWTDASEYVDRKWERAFEKAEAVRQGYRRLMDDPDADLTLGTSTHELGVRFLSALPLRTRPRLVTTDGEFHSLRRQLDRLAIEGIAIQKIPAMPADTLAERLCEHIDDQTAAVLVSSVFFKNARIVPNLGAVQEACTRMGAELFVDAYHTLNVTDFSIREEGLDRAFVTGGGYKYCQLGEGNCFLRVPPDCALRPVITGWFAEFEDLSTDTSGGDVPYGRGAAAFAGATYDPTSNYRAARVFNFFEEMDLTPKFLREVSQHQIGVLVRAFDDLDIDPTIITRDRDVDIANIAGFLSLDTPRAETLHTGLLEREVFTDWRDTVLRFGPAPYLDDDQLGEAMTLLGEVIRELP
jgi:kynureninase